MNDPPGRHGHGMRDRSEIPMVPKSNALIPSWRSRSWRFRSLLRSRRAASIPAAAAPTSVSPGRAGNFPEVRSGSMLVVRRAGQVPGASWNPCDECAVGPAQRALVRTFTWIASLSQFGNSEPGRRRGLQEIILMSRGREMNRWRRSTYGRSTATRRGASSSAPRRTTDPGQAGSVKSLKAPSITTWRRNAPSSLPLRIG